MNSMEQAIIQCALLENDGAMEAEITETDFSDATGAAIWLQICRSLSAGEHVDGLLLQNAFADDPDTRAALAGCLSVAASPSQRIEYERQIKRQSLKRRNDRLAHEMLASDDTPEVVASNAVSALIESESGTGKAEYNAQSLMAATMERIDAAASGQQLGLRTGWESLDDKLGGWHRGDLTIIAGRPGMGKSAFGMNAAINAAATGSRVGFVSVEMDAVSLGMRLASSQAGVSATDLRTGRLADADWPKLTQASNEIAQMPLRVLDAPAWQMSQIVRQGHAWHRIGLDILIVDYLQRVRPDMKTDRHDLAIGQMAMDCKTLAATLKIPVVLFSQLSRKVEDRADKRPNLSDLRESGQIEQEADNVIFLYRDAVYNDSADERAAELIVEKQRQGPTGIISMIWEGDRSLWLDDRDA